jgi:hypothetical protein
MAGVSIVSQALATLKVLDRASAMNEVEKAQRLSQMISFVYHSEEAYRLNPIAIEQRIFLFVPRINHF